MAMSLYNISLDTHNDRRLNYGWRAVLPPGAVRRVAVGDLSEGGTQHCPTGHYIADMSSARYLRFNTKERLICVPCNYGVHGRFTRQTV